MPGAPAAPAVSAVVRLPRAGVVPEQRAERMLRALAQAPVRRVSHAGLLREAWRVRASVSPYDALYVGLAARLACPLLTADRRLAAAPGLGISVTVVPA